MKYKNRLIVPTAVAMSLILAHPTVHADELESQHDEHPETQLQTITDSSETTLVDVIEEEEASSDAQPSDEIDAVQDSVDIEEPVESPVEETPLPEEVEEVPETEVEKVPMEEELHTEEHLDEINEPALNPEETITEENSDEEAPLQIGEEIPKSELKAKDSIDNIDEPEKKRGSLENRNSEDGLDKTSLDTGSHMDDQKVFHENELVGVRQEETVDSMSNNSNKDQDIEISPVKNSVKGDKDFKQNLDIELDSTSDFIEVESTGLMRATFSLKEFDQSPIFSNAQYATKIKSRNNSGLYSPITSSRSVSADRFLNTTLFIDRQGDYNGSTYYRILNGLDGPMQGWMRANDLNLFGHTDPSSHKQQYYVGSGSGTGYLLDEPWGTTKQRINQLSRYRDPVFNAEKSMKLGALTFYYGKIGNDYGWVQDRYLQDLTTPVYSDVQYATKIKSRNNSGLYSPITSSRSVSADRFLNTTLFIDRQGDYNGSTYYRILNGLDGPMQGWMKANDLNLFGHTDPSSHKQQYYVGSGSGTGYLLDEPWGTTKQRINQLSRYRDPVFNAEKSMKLGVLTFYYGKIGNDYGWVQDRYLTTNKPVTPSTPQVTTVRYNQSLNNVLNLQMNLSAKPQAWVSGGGWRNATRSEVRHFLDTSHQTGGTWDYTFLNLDQSQGISASVLNRQLLSNRGILTNRGSAFAQAARTHGVNEVYLISHAVLETGHGTSQLAQGVRLDRNGNLSNNGTKYYNMYGVGAVDNNALLGGARYAQRMGWDTPEKAIIGGASFVSQNYFNRGQNTLYAMRWNPRNPGTYQYATDVNWAYATARNLESYYRTLGVTGRYFTRYIF